MLIDLHVHTSAYSNCSRIPPRAAIDRAVAVGLTGMAFTEHGRFWPAEPWREIAAYAEEKEILLINGAEYRCRSEVAHQGDWLVFGIDALPPPGLSPAALIDAVHDAGGIVIPAHPYRAGLSIPEAAWDLPFDAVEATSGNQTTAENRASAIRAKERKLPAIGASDAHAVEEIGRHFTEIPAAVASAADLVAAIRAGRCAPCDRKGVSAGRGAR
jgi:hypothetical protein